MVSVGVWSTFAFVALLGAWLAATWEREDRLAIALIAGGGLLAAVVIASLPADRIVASRWCGPFFLAWSAGDIAIITTTSALDGGALSPVVGGLFCTMVFAGVCYPPRAVAFVSALTVVAFIVLGTGGVGTPDVDAAYVYVYAGTLALVGVMCLWQARIGAELRGDLARASLSDPLTGTLNRRGFEDEVAAELARIPAGAEGALVVLDVDDFKAVNDRHGHGAGDDLLCRLTDTARDAVRAGDSVGRLGGDEFALLLPGADRRAAERIASRIGAHLGTVGVSHGVACYPVDARTAGELHALADRRMYAYKRERPALGA
jgi:diguanylate cyclase (GGDEF)-like protein